MVAVMWSLEVKNSCLNTCLPVPETIVETLVQKEGFFLQYSSFLKWPQQFSSYPVEVFQSSSHISLIVKFCAFELYD